MYWKKRLTGIRLLAIHIFTYGSQIPGYRSFLRSNGISRLIFATRSRSISAVAICGSWCSSSSFATTSPHGLTIIE